MQIYLNIVGREQFLLGNHPFGTDGWERGHMWDYQVKLFVDTKVGNHGCRRRKSHHHWTALCGFFYTFCRM